MLSHSYVLGGRLKELRLGFRLVLMEAGDKVRIFLDEEIKKAEKTKNSRNPYAHSSVVELWKDINGRIGTVVSIDGDCIWAVGEQGVYRFFSKSVLVKVEDG